MDSNSLAITPHDRRINFQIPHGDAQAQTFRQPGNWRNNQLCALGRYVVDRAARGNPPATSDFASDVNSVPLVRSLLGKMVAHAVFLAGPP